MANSKNVEIVVDWKDVLVKVDRFVMGYPGAAEKKLAGQQGAYHYIPLGLGEFAHQMNEVRKHFGEDWAKSTCELGCCYTGEAKSFVDVGCGIGTKLVIARQFQLVPFGIELNPRYVKAAKSILSWDGFEGNIIQANALKEDYSAYDIIYFYCPLVNCSLQEQLEQRIVETARSGAVIMANLKQSKAKFWDENKALKRVWDNVIYQKL